jgi:hypothetical protein
MKLSSFLMAAALAAGCAGGQVHYVGTVSVADPNLVEVQPGVYAVADTDEQVFYNDGYYWLYRDGVWLRSPRYSGGYVAVDVFHVPQRIRVIERPHAYVHYRRSHRGPIVIRDHRHYRFRLAAPQPIRNTRSDVPRHGERPRRA